jgi:hypothetical protein
MKSKCCICKGKGVKYTENIRIYNGKKRDIGYWVVCQCQLLNNKKQYEKNQRTANKSNSRLVSKV